MRIPSFLVRALPAAAALLVPFGNARAVTPGVDIAAPRVVDCTTNDTLVFDKASQVVETGDYVRWRFLGTLASHTTTSGSVCLATDGLWDAPLNATSTEFTRQFSEGPGAYPYHCSPHCSLGMRGTVTVTTPIDLRADDGAGTLLLSWTGGGGQYVVHRSIDPRFPAAATVIFAPGGGAFGTTFTDTTVPAAGQVLYYLAMNLQP